MLKWKKAATADEIKEVAVLDKRIKHRSNGIKALKAERRAIILRCNVRGWRKMQ